MTIRWVYCVVPAFITWTDDIPENKGGVTNGLKIKIRPKYQNDKGLIEHELDHVRQNVRGFIPVFRMNHLDMEVEAYKNQLKYYPEDDTPLKVEARTRLFARYLATAYTDFSMTEEEAYKLLCK